MDELRKCPFCGGDAEVISAGRGKYQAQARCTQCHCELGAWYISKQAAAHAWNTRAEKKPTDAVREFAERYERRIAELEEKITESGVRATGGTLTADQVREAWCGNLRRDCIYDPPTPDWQAIADELNARAEQTCCDVSLDSSEQFYCSECECTVDMPLLWGELNYCPNCGAKVVG